MHPHYSSCPGKRLFKTSKSHDYDFSDSHSPQSLVTDFFCTSDFSAFYTFQLIVISLWSIIHIVPFFKESSSFYCTWNRFFIIFQSFFILKIFTFIWNRFWQMPFSYWTSSCWNQLVINQLPGRKLCWWGMMVWLASIVDFWGACHSNGLGNKGSLF